MTCIFAILALSLDIIVGYMGQFSFGHQAFFGIGAYASSLVTLRLGVPVWIGFLAAIASTAIFGFIFGYICLRRSRGLTLGIITLGFGVIMWMVACRAYGLTGGMTGLHNIPAPVISIPFLFRIELSSELSYYYMVLSFLVVTMYFISSLLRSRFGRALIALRENEDLASSIGISAFRYFLLTFTMATALAGFAGAVYAHHLRFVNPMLLSLHYTIILFIMVLVGGTRTLGGPLIGAFIFVFVPEHLPFSDQLKYMLFGVILFVCVLFMPRGVYPRLASYWNRFIALGGSGVGRK